VALQQRAADLGVAPADIANALRLLVEGAEVSNYEEHGEQYAVYVRAEKKYRADEEGLRLLTVPSMKLGFVALAVSKEVWMLYGAGVLLAFGNGLALPGISAYVSKRASESEQGGALGVNQSASSLGRVFGPALGGLIYGAVTHAAPYWFSAAGTGVAFLIALGLAAVHAPAQSTSTQTS